MKYEINQISEFVFAPTYINNSSGIIYCEDKHPLSSNEISFLHFHSCMEIGICLKGSGNCCIDNRIYKYQKGDMQIILPYQPHLSNSNIDCPSYWTWIFFDPYCLSAKNNLFAFDSIYKIIENEIGFTGIFSPSEFPQIASIILSLKKELTTSNNYSHQYSILLIFQLIVELSRIECNVPAKFTMKNGIQKLLPALNLIKEYQERELFLSVRELAEACSLSTSTLRRYFNDYLGICPNRYMENIRLGYAEYLLLNTELTISEIAYKAGYETLSCFTRSFHQKYHMSPTKFKNTTKHFRNDIIIS